MSGFWPSQPALVKSHRLSKLTGNFFPITVPADSVKIYRLSFSSSGREVEGRQLPGNAKKVLHMKLSDMLRVFFHGSDNRVFSPAICSACQLDLGSGYFADLRDAGQDFTLMDQQVLCRWLLRRLTSGGDRSISQLQRVGRHLFDAGRMDDRQTQVIGGFSASTGFFETLGSFLQVDTLYRAVHRKNALETVHANLEGELWDERSANAAPQLRGVGAIGQARVQMEWKRRCENAIVVTLHNNRVYRVKAVRFDLTPQSTFFFKDKKTRTVREMSYADFYRRLYNRALYDSHQPLLEAYAARESETVLLVPELCALTGLTEEMRKDRMLMQEVLQHSMVSTSDRLKQCMDVARGVACGALHILDEWGCRLSDQPALFDARVLDPVEVNFGLKRYTVDDGNFQRWTRNGAHCPVQLSRWIAIYPEQDKALVDMWLRSMRELGGSGFGMLFAEPQRFVCSNQPEELRTLLMDNITPEVQLVMLFTPQKDARRVYQTLKQITCTVRPCITQVVKSETMRKRQSIVAVVTRIVMQISAKLLGPLWHVNLNTPNTPMMSQPCMLVGIDICQSKETRKPVLGFVASLDAFASHHYTDAVLLTDTHSGHSPRTSKQSLVASKINICMKRALEAFAEHNDGILPTNIIVYRGSVPRSELHSVGQSEAQAVLDAVKTTIAETWADTAQPGGATKDCDYDPHVTYVLCVANVTARFFQSQPATGEMVSPQPGTVIESVITTAMPYHNFYLVNQHVARGTAVPTHYVVAYNSGVFGSDHLINLTYRLAHMYYNFPGSVRLPAPTQYARKLAHLVGTAVQAEIHPRLKETLFYL